MHLLQGSVMERHMKTSSLECKDPDVFWLRVRLLVKVEFADADGKYVLRLLNVVIHEHQFKRKGIYRKFHFDKEAYTKPKNVRIFTF
jgi:hypothetical protein